MRNKFVLCAVLLVFASGALWAQFWKDYSDTQRKAVARAYWLAGTQYQAIGKTAKGKELMELARIIDPQLDPSSIRDESMPSAAELLARRTASPVGGGAAEVPVQSLNSFFLRFLGALLDGDAAGAAGFLDGTIYVSKTSSELSRADAQSAFQQLFSSAPLAGKSPSDLYDLSTLTVSRADPAAQKAWGDAYTLRVDASADFFQHLSFWEQKQQFFIHRGAGDWYVFAVGQTAPPLTWKPQAGTPVAGAATAVSTAEAQASKGVTDAFDACLGAMLKKDADSAVQSMNDQVKFLRLNQTVTRDELKTSLEGAFENADFGSQQVSDVVDSASVVVEHAQSPVPEVSGTVYSLGVRAKADLSKMIPFWNTYQRYFFVNDNGRWKIFAIL